MELTSPPPRAPGHNSNFPPLQNDTILLAAQGLPVPRLPVWVMRQAGRFLPEFKALRENHDFFTMCTTPSLACETTLMPIRRFDVDAAIIFCDILVIPQAMGLEVQMVPGIGPRFPRTIESAEDLQILTPPPEGVFDCYYDAIYQTRHALQGKVPLLGFTGGPFTLMAYMIEGQGTKDCLKVKRWIYANQEAARQLMRRITDIIVDFLEGQINSGAQMIQVFESSIGTLSIEDYQDFVEEFLLEIPIRLDERLGERKVPKTIFPKGNTEAAKKLMSSNYDVIGVDWTVDIEEMVKLAESSGKSLQGNLDPALLYAEPELLERRTREMLRKFGGRRYICNLGHGITPETPISGMEKFIEIVHSISTQ